MVQEKKKAPRAQKKEQQASVSSQWWGLMVLLVGFNLFYSSVYLSPIMDDHLLHGEEGMMKKIGKTQNVEAITLELDEKSDGTTAVLVRNTVDSNVTLRLEIEVQNAVLWAQGQEQLLNEAWYDAAQGLRGYVVIRKQVEPTPVSWPITWIKPERPNMPWSVHIEHESYQVSSSLNPQRHRRNRRQKGGGSNHSRPLTRFFWGGTVTGGSNESAVAHRHFRIGSEFHSASHGIFFDVVARDRPIVLTGLRFHALASYQRHPQAPLARVSVFSAHKSALEHRNDYDSLEWYLIAEAPRAAVPAAPALFDIPIQPVYIAPRQQVSLALHSDFPFGVSCSVPSIEAVLRHERDKLPGEDWLPSWLTLALSFNPEGVKQSEWLKVLPGVSMGRQPLKTAPSKAARGFMGLLQYRVIGMYEAQDHGLSQLLQHHSSQRHGRHRRGAWDKSHREAADEEGGYIACSELG